MIMHGGGTLKTGLFAYCAYRNARRIQQTYEHKKG